VWWHPGLVLAILSLITLVATLAARRIRVDNFQNERVSTTS